MRGNKLWLLLVTMGLVLPYISNLCAESHNVDAAGSQAERRGKGPHDRAWHRPEAVHQSFG